MTLAADIIDAAARFGWAVFLLAVIGAGVVIFVAEWQNAGRVVDNADTLCPDSHRADLMAQLARDEAAWDEDVWAGDVEDAMWRHPSNAHIRKWDEEMGA